MTGVAGPQDKSPDLGLLRVSSPKGFWGRMRRDQALASRLREFRHVEQAQKLASALLLIPSFNKFVSAYMFFALFQLGKARNLVCVRAIEHFDVLNLVLARAEPDDNECRGKK